MESEVYLSTRERGKVSPGMYAGDIVSWGGKRTGQGKRDEEGRSKEKGHTSTLWRGSLHQSQCEKKCTEFFALSSEPLMGLSLAVSWVALFLVTDWVLHALLGEGAPNGRDRAVSQ